MHAALAELADILDRDGAVPLAWAVEHAPDGELHVLWDACEDLPVLARIAEHTHPRGARLLAACAGLREALRYVPLTAREVRRVLEVVEALARDEPVDPSAAARATREVARWRGAQPGRLGAYPTRAFQVALRDTFAAATAPRVERAVLPRVVRTAAAIVMTAPQPTSPNELEQRAWEARTARLAGRVRAELPCPALAAMLAALRARRVGS